MGALFGRRPPRVTPPEPAPPPPTIDEARQAVDERDRLRRRRGRAATLVATDTRRLTAASQLTGN